MDHSGVDSTCDNTRTKSVGAPCEIRSCHQGKKRVFVYKHHDGTYNAIGNLVKPQKCELVYDTRFAKRTRKKFSLFVVGEYQKVGGIKETHKGKQVDTHSKLQKGTIH
jgi:hypothetical protein